MKAAIRMRFGMITAMVFGILIPAAPASAQTAAELFDVNTLQEIRLFVNSRDLRTLRENTDLNTYYTADLTWRNIRVRNVGIRSRGQGSRNPAKIGLRVEMDRYTTGQTFLGLSTIILDNAWQDDSLIRERLAFSIFERMGLPAPRESFCRLFIDGEYQGVYTITEEIDRAFAKRVTGESDGVLFEYHYIRDWRAEDLGDLAEYKPMLEPRTHMLDADSTLYGPVQEMFREINGPDDAVWRDRVGQYIDLNQFMTHVATETFIAENDGILGYAGMNNFYLYRHQGTTKHQLFVWDKDNAFISLDHAVPAADANVLFRRAMEYPDLREIYFQTLEACAGAVSADDWLTLEIDRLVGVIIDAAYDDSKKQFSNERFDEAVEFLWAFAERRPREVLIEVARLRDAFNSESGGTRLPSETCGATADDCRALPVRPRRPSALPSPGRAVPRQGR
jgi:spore coat protein H